MDRAKIKTRRLGYWVLAFPKSATSRGLRLWMKNRLYYGIFARSKASVLAKDI